MNEKSPSITFQNRINNIKEGYEELGNLTIKLTGTVVRLLENYDETDFENIEECSTTIDIKTIDLEREETYKEAFEYFKNNLETLKKLINA